MMTGKTTDAVQIDAKNADGEAANVINSGSQ
jgi:hypothetical protein